MLNLIPTFLFRNSGYISSNSNIENNTILYTITSGRLPPGLSLDLDGEIIGKVMPVSPICVAII